MGNNNGSENNNGFENNNGSENNIIYDMTIIEEIIVNKVYINEYPYKSDPNNGIQDHLITKNMNDLYTDNKKLEKIKMLYKNNLFYGDNVFTPLKI